MKYKNEIYAILQDDDIANIDANLTIFAVAVIGILLGKETLKKLSVDEDIMKNREKFENEIRNFVNGSYNNDFTKEVLNETLKLIPMEIKQRNLSRIINILLLEDILQIALFMNIADTKYNSGTCNFPISSEDCINDLVASIFKRHGGRTVFNYDCGFGDFLTKMEEFENINKITGVTSNDLCYRISKIRSCISSNYIEIERENGFYPQPLQKYDMIYNSLPFMKRRDSIYETEEIVKSWTFPASFDKKCSENLFLIAHALQFVTINGILVALVTNGVLFNNTDKKMRKYFVDYNYIDTIISLPKGIVSNANKVATSLIILQNHKKNNTVKMIDATQIFSQQRKKIFFTKENIEEIMELYNVSESSELVLQVSNEDIIKNDYNLGFDNYRKIKYTLINPTILRTVTENIFRGYQIKATNFDSISTINGEDTEYRMINVSDIRLEGFVNEDLQPVIIEEPHKYNKYCVEDGDIIITAKNTTIKIAIYNERTYKAILTGNLIAIRTDKAKLDPYYLKAFLDSELGENMIKSIATGTMLFSINPKNLEKMEISLPPMDIQKLVAKEYKNNLIEIEEILDIYNNKLSYQKKIYDITEELL